jgi:TPR repeat protein
MLLKRLVAAAVVAVILSGAAIAGPREDADAAYQRGDYATALRLLKPLAEQGFAEAQYNLGFLYDEGEGVTQDYAEAAKWYRLAAEQGFADAQYNLGFLYDQGEGVTQDYVLAHMWWDLAAARGNENAAIDRDDLAAHKMTSDQITEAQRMAREWKPTTGQ